MPGGTIAEYLVGLGFEIDTAGAQQVEKTLQAISDAAQAVDQHLNMAVTAIQKSFEHFDMSGISAFSEALKAQGDQITTIQKSFEDFDTGGISAFSEALKAQGQQVTAIQKSFEDFDTGGISAFSEALKAQGDQITTIQKSFEDFDTGGVGAFSEALKAQMQQILAGTDQLDGMVQAVRAYGIALREVDTMIDIAPVITMVRELNDSFIRLNTVADSALNTMREKVSSNVKPLNHLYSSVEQVGEKFSTLPDGMIQALAQTEKFDRGMKNSFDWVPNAMASLRLLGTQSVNQGDHIATVFSTSGSAISAVFKAMAANAIASMNRLPAAASAANNGVSDEFSRIDRSVGSKFTSLNRLAATALRALPERARAAASGIVSAFATLRGVLSIIQNIAKSIKTQFTSAASTVVTQVGRIKSSLNTIPRTITVSVKATGAFSEGGVVDHETHATIGEGGKREYIIPVTKPARAVPLLKAAMKDMGMTLENTQHAVEQLGGSPMANTAPSYSHTQTTNNTAVNNHTVSAPATINVYGNDAKSIAQNVQRNHEMLIIRSLKGALA